MIGKRLGTGTEPGDPETDGCEGTGTNNPGGAGGIFGLKRNCLLGKINMISFWT